MSETARVLLLLLLLFLCSVFNPKEKGRGEKAPQLIMIHTLIKLKRDMNTQNHMDETTTVTNEEDEKRTAVRKSRKSYTVNDRIRYITAYKNYCASLSGKHEHPKKLSEYVKERNQIDGTDLSYSTVYKWYQKLQVDSIRSDQMKLSGSKKRNRPSPFEELEHVLIQIIRVRNQSLRSKGLPLTTHNYVKTKAQSLYQDMYCEERKLSNGWFARFKERFKDDFEDHSAYVPMNANTK